MLTHMTDAALLVQRCRAKAGLSTREMAARAGLSASTVARVEGGRMDPTVGTLRRLLAAAGQELGLEVRTGLTAANTAPTGPVLADLHDAWTSTDNGVRPDWTRLRAFLDDLAQHPDDVATAITEPPIRSRSRLMNALLAGIADKLADDAGLPRPSWTRSAGTLKRLWMSPGTPRMRKEARAAAPRQLLDRNIAIRQESLWRAPETVGA